MTSDAAIPRLEPKLSGFDTTMVVVSLVIGIGIFRTQPALPWSECEDGISTTCVA